MKKFTSFLLLALITLLVGLMFIGCGSRKSATSNTELIITEKDTLSENTKASDSSDIQINWEEYLAEQEKKNEITVEVKDGEALQIDQFDKNGKLTGSTLFKGSGKGVVKELETNKASAKSSQTTIKQESQVENNKNASSEKEVKLDEETKKTYRKNNYDLYIGIGFLVFLFFLIWRLKRKGE